MNKLNKRGDTIVEVMIAIVILGAAIGGAFAVANKSQQNAQANHERYQAQLLANQQAEYFRSHYATFVASGDRASYPSSLPGTFCFDSSANPTGSCVNGLYTIQITRVSDANAGIANPGLTKLNFDINISWDGLNGRRQSLDLVYGL